MNFVDFLRFQEEGKNSNVYKIIEFIRKYNKKHSLVVSFIHDEWGKRNLPSNSFGLPLSLDPAYFPHYLDNLLRLYNRKVYPEVVDYILYEITIQTFEEYIFPDLSSSSLWNQRYGWMLSNQLKEVGLAIWEYFSSKYTVDPSPFYIDAVRPPVLKQGTSGTPGSGIGSGPIGLVVGLTEEFAMEIQHVYNNLHQIYFLWKVSESDGKGNNPCVFGRVTKEEAIEAIWFLIQKYSIDIQQKLFFRLNNIFGGKEDFPEIMITQEIMVIPSIKIDHKLHNQIQNDKNQKENEIYYLGQFLVSSTTKNRYLVSIDHDEIKIISGICSVIGRYPRSIQDTLFSRLKTEIELLESISSGENNHNHNHNNEESKLATEEELSSLIGQNDSPAAKKMKLMTDDK